MIPLSALFSVFALFYIIHIGSLQHVSSGGIFDEAKVVRIDKSGLLLELPSKPTSTPAYVSVCPIGHPFWKDLAVWCPLLTWDLSYLQTYDAAGDEVKKLEKNFKTGNLIRVRILGLKQMEGLAIGTLKVLYYQTC